MSAIGYVCSAHSFAFCLTPAATPSCAYYLLTVPQALGDAMGDDVRHRLCEFKGTPRTCPEPGPGRASRVFTALYRAPSFVSYRARVCVCVCARVGSRAPSKHSHCTPSCIVTTLPCAKLWARVSPRAQHCVRAGVPSRHPLRARYPHCLQLEPCSRGMCGRVATGAALSTSHPAPYRQGRLDDQRRWNQRPWAGT